MWKPHATAEDEDGQTWRAAAGEAPQSLDPGAQPGAPELVLFRKPCQRSCISGLFPWTSTRRMAGMLFWKHQPISNSLIPLPPTGGLCQPLAMPSLALCGCPQQAGSASTLSRGAGSWLWLTFGFKSKVTVLADVRPDVCVRANVFLQHAGFLAANSTLLTNILPSSTASHIHILFV